MMMLVCFPSDMFSLNSPDVSVFRTRDGWMNDYQHARMIYICYSFPVSHVVPPQSASLVLLACQILLLPLNERSGTLRQMPLKKRRRTKPKITSFLDYVTTVDKPN